MVTKLATYLSKAAYNKEAPEADIQAAICELLAWLKLPFSVTDASRVWGPNGKPRPSKVTKGWPDITGCLPSGRMFAIEVKSKTGRISPEQKVTLELLRQNKAAICIARSVEDAFNFLYEHLPNQLEKR